MQIYCYEENGQLSMIPWDYNLAFGGFQSSDASDTVNSPIDSPVTSGSMDDRPMVRWIFENEEYTALYHRYYAELIETVDFAALIDGTAELIAPYVEKDPTKFCTAEEFERGTETLRTFCELREESVSGQLVGTIPSTAEGQSADGSALIDASAITLSDMGSMNTGGGFGGGQGGRGGRDSGEMPTDMEIPEMSEMGEMQETVEMPSMPGEETDEASEERPSRGNGNTEIPNSPETPDGFTFDSFGSFEQPPTTAANTTGWLWIGISALVLCLGLIIAAKYKTR